MIGFGPAERPSEAVFSVVVFPRWIPVRELMDDAVELMEVKFAPGQKSKAVIRQVAKKRRC